MVLFFSIIESKLILPAHLAHANIGEIDEDEIFSPYSSVAWYKWPKKLFQRANRSVQKNLHVIIKYKYAPWFVHRNTIYPAFCMFVYVLLVRK